MQVLIYLRNKRCQLLIISDFTLQRVFTCVSYAEERNRYRASVPAKLSQHSAVI